MPAPPLILGIETSCDETAAAVVDGDGQVLGHAVLSQIDAHNPYGGVVPEIAARAHVEQADRMVILALEEAGVGLNDLDAIAVTAGPGLIGGVIVGVVTAKALALAANKPLIAVNHLEGHALSPRLTDDVPFPYLLLLVSGGHCQLLIVSGPGRYQRLGSTIDDAVGEAFDKTAKLLGLGYPGGPNVEAAAAQGDAARFALPRPLLRDPEIRFSFSGLKTAVRRQAERLLEAGTLDDQARADLCAGFQAAVADCLVDRSRLAMTRMRETSDLAGDLGDTPGFVVAGGVAANETLRTRLQALAVEEGFKFAAPPSWLCTDNGAMIAWAGVERYRAGLLDDLTAPARPRWPLDPEGAPVYGRGKKGAKV